jgi:hypothetical protein
MSLLVLLLSVVVVVLRMFLLSRHVRLMESREGERYELHIPTPPSGRHAVA